MLGTKPDLRIKVDTKGLDRAQRMLRTINRFVDDLRPALNDIGNELVRSAHRRFLASRGPNGAAWKATKAGNKPLIRTGALMRSIRYDVARRKVTIGSPLPYAAIHQFGGKAGRRGQTRIPARPYLVDRSGRLDRGDAEMIERVVADLIRRKAQAN